MLQSNPRVKATLDEIKTNRRTDDVDPDDSHRPLKPNEPIASANEHPDHRKLFQHFFIST